MRGSGSRRPRLPFVSWERAGDVLRATFWLVPALCVLGAIGLGAVLIAADERLGTARTILLFPGPPEGARTFLSAVIQAMISFTGLVFSITVVVLQLSSGQFSPRVLRTFLQDRFIQSGLGVFIATFVYAMVVLRAVQGTTGHPEFVPRIAVTVAFGFVLLSVALFIGYISHVANLVRVATIIELIGAETRAHIERRCPRQDTGQPSTGHPPTGSPPDDLVRSLLGPARTLPAPRPGVVVAINERALTDLAERTGRVVTLVPRVGDFVPAGAPLLLVRPDGAAVRSRDDAADADADAAGDDAALVGMVAFDVERTAEQDIAFGMRQLVDIAERALSPAVNDPTTATQVLDELHDLLRRLAGRHLPDGCVRDRAGRVRLVVPQYAFGDYLDFALGEIWRYGADAAQIPGRLRALLTDLATAALSEHRPAVARWAERVGAAR